MKAVAACGGGIPPLAQIFGGAQPVGAASPQALQQMQLGILTYLASINNGASVIGGAAGSVGLACAMHQFRIACGQLRGLECHPWFQTVLTQGPPLTGTLATIYMPRPRVAPGLSDRIPLACKLWI